MMIVPDSPTTPRSLTRNLPITAVIFDLDDTLMPEHPADYAALEATAGVLPDDASIAPLEFRRVALDAARAHWEGTAAKA